MSEYADTGASQWHELELAEKRVHEAVSIAKAKLERALRELEIRLERELYDLGGRIEFACLNRFIADEHAYLDDRAADVAGSLYRAVERRVG